MAEEILRFLPAGTLSESPVPYVVDFDGQQRKAGGVVYRFGRSAFGEPVAQKIPQPEIDGQSRLAPPCDRLRRERDVARYLGPRGGELLSRCLGTVVDPASTVVTFRGRPLAELAGSETAWPPAAAVRAKIVRDLLQGLELLRVSSIVHGDIGLETLYWDGSTLQITDFGQAALCGTYLDGRVAHPGDDIAAAGRVIYHVYTGQAPPAEPAELRRQLMEVQDWELSRLLLRRDPATGADLDYAFAADPARRPTAQAVLDRLEQRPHGVQWAQIVDRDQRIRADFRRLRQRQQSFAEIYGPWAGRRRPLRPAWPLRTWPPQPGPRAGSGASGRGRATSRLLLTAVAAGLFIAVLALLGLL